MKLPKLKQISWRQWCAIVWLFIVGGVALYFVWSMLPLLALALVFMACLMTLVGLTAWSIMTVSDFIDRIAYNRFL